MADIRFCEREATDHDGQTLVKLLPEPVLPAMARVGMAVTDAGRGDHGIVVHMTPHLCIYVTPDGEEQAAPWLAISLDAVQPDPDQVEGVDPVNGRLRRRC